MTFLPKFFAEGHSEDQCSIKRVNRLRYHHHCAIWSEKGDENFLVPNGTTGHEWVKVHFFPMGVYLDPIQGNIGG